MADENAPDLQDRLSTFSQKGKAKRRGGNIGVGALAIALALGGGGAAYFLATNLQEGSDGLETSDVETFQDQRTGNGGRLEFPPDEAEQRVNDALIAVEEALDVPAPAPAAEPSAAATPKSKKPSLIYERRFRFRQTRLKPPSPPKTPSCKTRSGRTKHVWPGCRRCWTRNAHNAKDLNPKWRARD